MIAAPPEHCAPRAVTRAPRGLAAPRLYPLTELRGRRFMPVAARRIVRRRLTEAGVAAHLGRCRSVRMIGVTGSMGKTTLKDLLAEMLAEVGPTYKTHHNDNGLYGVPATLLAVRPGDRFAVIEVGIQWSPGEMRWMASLFSPEVAVLTGIGEDHSSAYGSREAVAREKRALLERIPPEGTVVVNGDDPLAVETTAGLHARVLRAGEREDCDVRLVGARSLWPHGQEVEIEAFGRVLRAQVALHARHLAPLAALALAAATACGVEPERALAGAQRFRPHPGRMAPRPGPNGSTLLIDHFKSRLPTALAAVRTLGEAPARRRIAVLGELQEREQTPASYAPLAELLPGRADMVVAVGRAGPPLAELLTGTALGQRVHSVVRVGDAAALLRDELGEGDVALLHGALRQHLQRVELLLDGAAIGCHVQRCTLHVLCADCGHLRHGPPPELVEAA